LFKLKPTVLVLRHGNTQFNSSPGGSPERIRGWIDVPLDEEGVQQAQAAAAKIGRLPLKRIVSSDLQRAAATAQAVAAVAGVPLETSADLRPWNLGAYAGQPIEQVKPRLDELMVKYPRVNAPGGESYAQFLQRFLTKLASLMQEAEASPDDGFIVAVAHTRNLRAAEAWVTAGMPGATIPPEAVKQIVERKEQVDTGRHLLLYRDEEGWRAQPELAQSPGPT